MDRRFSFGHFYFRVVIVWDMNRSKCMSPNLPLALVSVDTVTQFSSYGQGSGLPF
jgi:hypothetical protein